MRTRFAKGPQYVTNCPLCRLQCRPKPRVDEAVKAPVAPFGLARVLTPVLVQRSLPKMVAGHPNNLLTVVIIAMKSSAPKLASAGDLHFCAGLFRRR